MSPGSGSGILARVGDAHQPTHGRRWRSSSPPPARRRTDGLPAGGDHIGVEVNGVPSQVLGRHRHLPFLGCDSLNPAAPEHVRREHLIRAVHVLKELRQVDPVLFPAAEPCEDRLVRSALETDCRRDSQQNPPIGRRADSRWDIAGLDDVERELGEPPVRRPQNESPRSRADMDPPRAAVDARPVRPPAAEVVAGTTRPSSTQARLPQTPEVALAGPVVSAGPVRAERVRSQIEILTHQTKGQSAAEAASFGDTRVAELNVVGADVPHPDPPARTMRR